MLRTNLVVQWQMSALAETCSGPIQIWWHSGRCLHSRRSAQAPNKFGSKVADGRGCENLPRCYTNWVAPWQMPVVVKICLDLIQIWWLTGRQVLLQRSAYVPYKFGGTVADVCTCEDLLRPNTNLVVQWQMSVLAKIC